MSLALAIEHNFSKNQILELYLNKVYFGSGAYGVDSASRLFFGHSAKTLNLHEAALLAGLLRAPARYSPLADIVVADDRAKIVMQAMAESGAITRAEAGSPGSLMLSARPDESAVRYFVDWALPQLETLINERQAPLDVYTTLDVSIQRAADEAIAKNVPAGAQGALVSLDREGAVRAMVGGTDSGASSFNRATQAVRKAGSSFNLFVYLASLEAGHRLDDTVVDEPVTIGGWTPRNYSKRKAGPVTLRAAFAYSLNTVAAKLGQEVGFDTIADMARRFGITTPVENHPSMVLGTSGVRLIEMTRAFASVGQNGVSVTPHAITRVEANGKVIYQHSVDSSQVLVAPYVAAQMIDLLRTAINTNNGEAAKIGRPVAGMPGITASQKDGWFLGFSSGLTTGVWFGRDDDKPVADLDDGIASAKAFAAFMRPATRGRPVEPLQTDVVLPEWQLESDQEAYFGDPDGSVNVDADGNPTPGSGEPDATSTDTPAAANALN